MSSRLRGLWWKGESFSVECRYCALRCFARIAASATLHRRRKCVRLFFNRWIVNVKAVSNRWWGLMSTRGLRLLSEPWLTPGGGETSECQTGFNLCKKRLITRSTWRNILVMTRLDALLQYLEINFCRMVLITTKLRLLSVYTGGRLHLTNKIKYILAKTKKLVCLLFICAFKSKIHYTVNV